MTDPNQEYMEEQRALFPGLDTEFDRGIRRILDRAVELECEPNVPYSPNHKKLADKGIYRGPVLFRFSPHSLADVINALTDGGRKLQSFSLQDVGYVTPETNGKPLWGTKISERMKIVYAKIKE